MARGHVLNRDRRLPVQRAQQLGRHVALAGRSSEPHFGLVHRQHVAPADQLGVPYQQEPLLAGQLLQHLHGAHHLRHLAGPPS